MLFFKHKTTILPSALVVLFLLISLIGFTDASYLTSKHYQGEVPTCSTDGGCTIVTTSSYSVVAGVPVALAGAVYYLTIFIATLLYFERKPSWYVDIVPYLTILGFLASVWFVYVQLFVLHAICWYCMGSALSSTILFMLGMYVIYLSRRDK